MTVDTLKDCNKKLLAKMAKERGIVGWHAMRKDQLIRALTPAPAASRQNGRATQARPAERPAAASRSRPEPPGRAQARRSVVPVPPRAPAPLPPPRPLEHGCGKDRIITMVRDPYWLHTYWELSRGTLGRARAALGQEWHGARPILRLMDVTSEDTTAAGERHVRDIEIHGGVNNWYIDIATPTRSFRVDIGYLTRRGKFYILARSNVVTTPKAGVCDVFDQNWVNAREQYERLNGRTDGRNGPCAAELRELMEERLRRPLNGFSLQGLGAGAFPGSGRPFHFELNAELIVYGATEPTAKVTLQGEPVQLRPDGTFTVRFDLPDSRQIIPAVAASPDGVEERTIVLAVERNTKELEPMIHDGNEL
ncbi:MAG TPA: DUF4912 domain-containing protein [Isosphaeraceae bacterium]|jgi:hypothetical protein|nr:DUF4912 domain-containing protein [Isosphaeraceae bacterium]